MLSVDPFDASLISAGLVLTALLIGAAFCFRRSGATDERLKVRLTSWATIFFGSGDFLTDVLFAKLVLSNGFFRCPTEGDSCAAIDDTPPPNNRRICFGR